MDIKLEKLLSLSVEQKASDVHLAENAGPVFRIQGELVAGVGVVIEPEMMKEVIWSLTNAEQRKIIEEKKELDFSVSLASGDRFRVNVFMAMGKLCAALRVIPRVIPDLDTLGIPKICTSFLSLKQGFILFTGPTGQGKSTSVASLINEINKNQARSIVTIEDPVEYVISPVRSLIYQREVFFDTDSFVKALKSCLRQDPNVVYVGEMRDLETISSALTMAETGHLVFSTLHTNSAAQTVDRIIDVFPEGSKGQIRAQLAEVLTAIVSQRLIPTVEGKRVLACEVLVANSAVRNSIREGKTFMVDNIIQTSAEQGMVGMESYLAGLVRKGIVAEEVALKYSFRPAELQQQLRAIRSV